MKPWKRAQLENTLFWKQRALDCTTKLPKAQKAIAADIKRLKAKLDPP